MTRTASRWRALPPLLAALLVFAAVPAAAQTAVEPLGTADTTVDLGGITAGATGALRLSALRACASSDDDAGRSWSGRRTAHPRA